MAAILHTTYDSASCMNVVLFWYKFDLKLVPSIKLTIKVGSDNEWLGIESITKYRCPNLLMQLCTIKTQWVKMLVWNTTHVVLIG